MQINLDDRSYEQLLSEAMKLMAKDYSSLTDFSPSDLAVILVELFSFLMEAAIYQINCVPDRCYENFARLLAVSVDAEEPVEVVKSQIMKQLQRKHRAVSTGDIEAIAADFFKNDISDSNQSYVKIKAVADKYAISLIIDVSGDAKKQAKFNELKAFLESLSPLGTIINVIPPDENYISIYVNASSDSNIYVDKSLLKAKIINTIKKYFDPRQGYEGKGWEFGRAVYESELYHVIESIEGVDHLIFMKIINNCNECQERNNCAACIQKNNLDFSNTPSLSGFACSKNFVPRISEGILVYIDGQ